MRRGAAHIIGAVAAAVVAGPLLGLARPALAQEVSFVPRPDRPVERRLDHFLHAGGYRLWTRDTVLAPGAQVDGPVLVLGATVRSAATVHGSIYVVAGDLFLRPGARVEGDAMVLGGGWYSSSLATVEGEVVYRPNLLLRVDRRGSVWEIVPVENVPRAVSFEGFYGFSLPTYDRVEAWTFSWGATARATRMAWQPSLSARLQLHTRGIQALGGRLRQSWYPTGTLRVDLVGERRTRTNEDWIRGDVSNSLAYLFGSGDYRDYYRSERLGAGVLTASASGWHTEWSAFRERDRSLPALRLPVFFKSDSDVRPNPTVQGGTLWSARALVGYRRRAGSWRLDASVSAEAADSSVAGDFSFLLGEARVSGRTEAIPGVRLAFFGIARGDLSGSLPGQRWSALGGTGTLPTLPVLPLRGSRLLFGQVTLAVPLGLVEVPAVGGPQLFVRNAVGSAWGEGTSPHFTDNVIGGVRLFLVEAGLAIDPSASNLDPTWVFGVRLPASARR
ncbi:MAG: hypothetical protein Q8W47_04025 [Candidatus Palauibacterales bacterium]|nr:hypothetical protein [Candidatus Palauibacterales bacterium]